ncbi:polyphosphate polymerase domain-containing protein [Enterococcus timonensis]|uniref:polyphosphate polymerase domain-containing protein n=1 Tax=Enterococcus timonensis TaxID=1852364 RepID=UPI0008DB2B11|nr:polyphosphate polymerase domain-containing protein [Enterococcus timonensis]
MKLKNRFQRKEKKYLLTEEQYAYLQQHFSLMQMDQYGKHTILSLYYDDSDFTLIKRSIAKPNYKEKFRVRSYGCQEQNGPIFLEIKKKVNGIVYKRRLQIEDQQLATFNQQPKRIAVDPSDQQVKSEIDYLVERMHLYPQVLIAYDREAFFGVDDEDFRITFDHQIRFRTDQLDFHHGSSGEKVTSEFAILMEVKALGAYPLWFSQLLSQAKIYPGSFSKYKDVYQHHLSTTNNIQRKEEMHYAS